jgi:hypothetical protein
MQLGNVAETVEVQSITQLLQPATSSLGAVVERRKVEDLPLNGRNPLALVALTPGVVPQGFSQDAPAVPNFYAWGNFQIGGALGNQSEAMLDGGSIHGSLMNGVRLVPTEDTIQEFKVQTNNLSAEFGHTAGGIINLTTKSGSNTLHGSLFEYLRNEVLDANNFFNNSKGVEKPAFTQNQFGGTLGGTIRRDKLFFFGSYEGFRQRRGRSFLLTVPTPEQREGDFSKTFDAQGNLIPIYDPLTTRPDPNNPGRFLRDPFPGNIIPQSRLDPAAKVLAKRIYGNPNVTGAPFTNINNFATNAAMPADADQYSVRLDYVLSPKQRIFGRYSFWRADTPGLDPFKNGTQVVLDIFPDFRKTRQVFFEDVYTFSPSLIADFRYSFLRFDYKRIPLTQGEDLSALGLSPNLNQQIAPDFRHIPNFTVAGMTLIFPGSIIFQAEDNHHVVGNVTKVWSRHTAKFGVDFRVFRLNYLQSNDTSGAFSFNNLFTASDPLRPTGGIGFASFMLGYPASGVANTPAFLAQQRSYRAFYFQDDFRASNKLTLNLGLRYDQEGGWTERYDRQSFFMPEAEHPAARQTGLPLRGRVGLVNSPDRESRHLTDTFPGQLGPRFGFAYSLTGRTVLRGGYGISWLPKSVVRREVVVEPTGTGTTVYVDSLNGGLTPFGRLNDPFPNGIVQPVGRDPIFQSRLTGTSLRAKLTSDENAYTQQWNFNIQQQLPGDMLVDVAYAGLKGTKLPQGVVELNQLPDQYLSMGAALLAQVPNPFFGLIESGPLSARTVAQGQLLRPYPHYNSVALYNPFIGSSIYHSLQLKVEKRFKGGAGLLASYTASKLISDVETATTWLESSVATNQNNNNLKLERSLSSQDVPQRLVISGTFDLPFGRSRRFLSNFGGLPGKLISGWSVNGIYTAQSGMPIALVTAANLTNSFGGRSRPNNNGQSARLTSPATERLNRWFDTSKFSQPPAFTFGNVSRTLPDVRSHGINNLDFSIFKNTQFGPNEKLNLQFRTEIFNIFNRPQFGYPGNAFGTPQFGVVANQANEPRLIQFALKLVF